MAIEPFLLSVCAGIYALLAAVTGFQAPQRTNGLLAGCCLVSAAWAAGAVIWPHPTLYGITGPLDLLRALAWYCFILHLYWRSAAGPRVHTRAFTAVAVAVTTLSIIVLIQPDLGQPATLSLFSLPIVIRLGLAVAQLLLIENLYFNLPEHSRWHVAVPCVLLGGMACFDVLLCADVVLYHEPSVALTEAREAAMIIIAPALVVAAIRGRRWDGQIKLSRSAVFHSATLVLSGGVLLALGLAGEVLRQMGPAWGGVAEISLVFAGLIGLGLLLSSRSARSLLQRTVVQHFFADRYDYRRQWLACIDALSATGSDGRTALHTRAIRAVADVVDSPNGVLFLREGGVGAFAWAGSWNMPASGLLPPDHPIVAETRGGEWVVDLRRSGKGVLNQPPLPGLGPLWLAVPLLHHAQHTGFVLLGPPRVPFRLDQEVFDLLRILGREVATYIGEQRATQVLVQTRHLHDYSKRFAFVAHDIKNVASQLALLLRNAEHHIANPEFQKDMLETVSASVQKITALLKRLEAPEADRAPAALTPVPRLEALVATYRRVRNARLILEHDGSTGTVAMGPDAFDTAVTHLVNNAVEASGKGPVLLRVRHEVARVVIDIVDQGPGMSPEFVRDQLFKPFSSQKEGGSGIGAFQARELLREAGGELVVISAQGGGTTMRMTLARADVTVSTGGGVELVAEAGD